MNVHSRENRILLKESRLDGYSLKIQNKYLDSKVIVRKKLYSWTLSRNLHEKCYIKSTFLLNYVNACSR